MEETSADVMAARAKLAARFDARLGGKGTARRKQKTKAHTALLTDDKKLQGQMKRLGLNTIPGIEEVNMFTDSNTVIHFKDPKVQASLQANTYVVSGVGENKSLQAMLPKVISQLGMNNLGGMAGLGDEINLRAKEKDEIPDIETNFEDVSKADIEVD